MTDSSGAFKISPQWGCILSFDELIERAKFIFTHSGHKGYRPTIVLNKPIEGNFDMIEIDHDSQGIITNGISSFNEEWGSMITDSGHDYISFVRNFLTKTGAVDLLSNKDTKIK